MKKLLFSAALAALAFSACNTEVSHGPWTKGGIETGKYRNYFAEMGHSQSEIDAKLQEVFNEVFVNEDTKVYFEVGDSLGYISDIKNHDVRTEGMSYGLMIAVQWDRKDIFDRIWRWCKLYMQHQDGPQKGYFAWSCDLDGRHFAEGPASDGELYYVTSLLFASNRWGNDSGINYLAEAQNILNCSWEKTGEVPEQFKDSSDRFKNMVKVLPLIDKDKKLITFTPGGFGAGFTDPSYHLPVFYEIWAKYAEDGRADFYLECQKASREYLHKSIDSITGLNPDYNNYDGSMMEARWIKPAFRYDSWRVPMNMALDFSWSNADRVWQSKYAATIQNFFYSKGIDDYVDQYQVDGSSVVDTLQAGSGDAKVVNLRHSVGLVSTLATASLMTDNPHAREFAERLWNSKNEPYSDGYFDAYYDGILRLFAFMHMSGRYQVIDRK